MLRVGLTGGIAAGKSAAADRLIELGACVIDADVLAREVVEPGTAGLRGIVARFGPDVLAADGRLDRPRLAALVFADKAARADLNAIVHPLVRAAAREREAECRRNGASVVVHVIPLLVETGQADAFDEVIVVDLDPAEQRRRLIARNGLPPEQADARIRAQATREDRLAAADEVWDNSGALGELASQVDRWFASRAQRH